MNSKSECLFVENFPSANYCNKCQYARHRLYYHNGYLSVVFSSTTPSLVPAPDYDENEKADAGLTTGA